MLPQHLLKSKRAIMCGLCGCIALILDRILHERLGDKREPETEPQHRDFMTNTIIVDLSSHDKMVES